MNEVNNFALLSAIKISKCYAGCLLKIDLGKREILSSVFSSNDTTPDYNEIMINSFDEKLLELIKPKKAGSAKHFPSIIFCKKIADNKRQKNKIYFILTSFKQKNISLTIKKTLDVLAGSLIEFHSEQDSDTLYDSQSSININKNDTLYELSGDLIFVLDKNGKFLYVNTAGALMLEWIPDELLNRYLIDLIPAHQLNSFTKYFNELIKFNSSNPFRTSFVKMNGEEISIQLRCKVQMDGEVLKSIYGIARRPVEESIKDELHFFKHKLIETERILMIERSRVYQQKAILEELNRMKNDFISNISHEFRTPLASIIGFSETIDSETDIDKETKYEFNREVLNEAKRLAKLINEVLDTSLVAGKKILLNKTSFDIVGLIKEVINENSLAMKEKNIILSPELPFVETLIFADRNKISNVLSSLLKHSISSSVQKGRITILLSDFDEEIEIIITDTGYGISENEINKLTEVEHSIMKENFTSEPLHSLVFTKQIVDLHGGLFTFESELSRGTSFVIKLPRIKNLQQS